MTVLTTSSLLLFIAGVLPAQRGVGHAVQQVSASGFRSAETARPAPAPQLAAVDTAALLHVPPGGRGGERRPVRAHLHGAPGESGLALLQPRLASRGLLLSTAAARVRLSQFSLRFHREKQSLPVQLPHHLGIRLSV